MEIKKSDLGLAGKVLSGQIWYQQCLDGTRKYYSDTEHYKAWGCKAPSDNEAEECTAFVEVPKKSEKMSSIVSVVNTPTYSMEKDEYSSDDLLSSEVAKNIVILSDSTIETMQTVFDWSAGEAEVRGDESVYVYHHKLWTFGPYYAVCLNESELPDGWYNKEQIKLINACAKEYRVGITSDTCLHLWCMKMKKKTYQDFLHVQFTSKEIPEAVRKLIESCEESDSSKTPHAIEQIDCSAVKSKDAFIPNMPMTLRLYEKVSGDMMCDADKYYIIQNDEYTVWIFKPKQDVLEAKTPNKEIVHENVKQPAKAPLSPSQKEFEPQKPNPMPTVRPEQPILTLTANYSTLLSKKGIDTSSKKLSLFS